MTKRPNDLQAKTKPWRGFSPRVRFVLKTMLLLESVLAVAILTPHLVRGHLLLSEQFSQSGVLFLDFILAFLFFGIYYRDIAKLKRQAVITETRLTESFRYIGKANVTLELFSDFIRTPYVGFGHISDRAVFHSLLRKILVSVLRSNAGILRIVDRSTLRSITEFRYPLSSDYGAMNLPNSILRLDDKEEIIRLGENSVLCSVLPHEHFACILIYRHSQTNENLRLAFLLLSQIHLLFLLSEKRNPKLVVSEL